jgi:preprotein translocase subunit Sec61beta
MARDDRISMPQSVGGLVRYFDEYKSKLHVKPHYVVAIIILLAIIAIVLNANAAKLLP